MERLSWTADYSLDAPTESPRPERRTVSVPQASVELDRRVAVEVMGWTPRPQSDGRFWETGGDWGRAISEYETFQGTKRISFAPSRNIEDAWEVVERLRLSDTRWGFNLDAASEEWTATFYAPRYSATASTASLAICMAALATAEALKSTAGGR